MTRFVVVPQWQGSPSTRAMSLIDGADAIAGDLPRSAVQRVEVPFEAGESLDTGVRRASALRRLRERVDEALAAEPEGPVVTIGGDCGVAVPSVGRVAGDDLAVVWFDAHGDLHTPDSSPSGAFAGMALAGVLGRVPGGLSLAPGAIAPSRVVLAGARALEDAERESVAESGIRHVRADRVAEDLAAAVAATGARRLYVHVDLDVLDPAHIAGVQDAQPFGLAAAALVDAIAAVREVAPLAGASVTGFAPRTPEAAVDDLGTILRVVGALARP
ncbi:arginase family protein [Microbacterium sp. ZXX196]|uniref:arginase family protein n=1 Tax=Microbacterium sp. ZXX196 TaxID=2609291 RepID=UPI0012B782A6|nr:arginase family protein [Microbacterium sp. ZXX196]MTE23061.1 arginase family protein [Microbacterium sp. ZXX196]